MKIASKYNMEQFNLMLQKCSAVLVGEILFYVLNTRHFVEEWMYYLIILGQGQGHPTFWWLMQFLTLPDCYLLQDAKKLNKIGDVIC